MPDSPETLPTCPRCGAEAVIPDARLVDRGDSDARKNAEVGVMRAPEAVLFKDEVRVPLRAQICGECGFVELYAQNPAALWSAYLDRLQRIWDRGA